MVSRDPFLLPPRPDLSFTSKPPEVLKRSCEMEILNFILLQQLSSTKTALPLFVFLPVGFLYAWVLRIFFLLEILNSAETKGLFLRNTRENFLFSQEDGNFKVWSYNVCSLSTSLKEGVSASATMMQSKLSCLWIPNQSVLRWYSGGNLAALRMGGEGETTKLLGGRWWTLYLALMWFSMTQLP